METSRHRGGPSILFHHRGWIDLGQPYTHCPQTAQGTTAWRQEGWRIRTSDWRTFLRGGEVGLNDRGGGSLVTLVASKIEFSLWKVGLVGTMTWTYVWDVEERRALMLRVCRNAFNVTLAPALIRYFVTPLVEHNMNQIVSLHQSERHACRISSCVWQLKSLPGRRLQSAAEVSVPGWLVLSSGHFLH